MEKICPVCNSLTEISQLCPCCEEPLIDGGPLENYYGAYSPYMDVLSLQYGLPDRHCVHLLYCPACQYDTCAAWELMCV